MIGNTAIAEPIVAAGYRLQQLVPSTPFCGVHGLGIDGRDNLFAGSVVAQRLYGVDKNSGAASVLVGPPRGMADDMEFLPDGTLVWTSISQNAVRALSADGTLRDLATDLRSVNSIAYRASDGRLFVAQVFGGDGLWEIDINGGKGPRNILKDIGGLNGFDIGPDGMIYGPLWFKQQVVKINPDSGELTVVADGFHTPAAANFDSRWNLYVLDTGTGEIFTVDINGSNTNNGNKTLFLQLKTSLDNLAIDSNDTLYVSNMADNSIHAVNLKTKVVRVVVNAGLSCPSGIAVARDGAGDVIYVADVFALRRIDGRTGAITDIARSHAADTPIEYATGVFVGKQHFYVISSGRLQQYDRATDTRVRVFEQVRQPRYVLELPGGDLLVLSQNGRQLTRYSGDGNIEQKIISGTLDGVASLALLDGNTVLATVPAQHRVIKIFLDSGATESVPLRVRAPVDIAVHNAEQWFIRESGGRVLRVNPATGESLTVLDNFPSGLLDPNAGNSRNSFGIGRNGVLYLASDIDNGIYTIHAE